MSVNDLPAVNASLNAIATVLLTAGFVFIKGGRIAAHRACMMTAFVVSAIFLITYVLHKYLVGFVNARIGAEGAIKTFYLSMLASHVILAIVIVPLVLVTIRFALLGRFAQHKAWARWTYPLWYYVSVTGVLVYFFVYQWFPHR